MKIIQKTINISIIEFCLFFYNYPAPTTAVNWAYIQAESQVSGIKIISGGFREAGKTKL